MTTTVDDTFQVGDLVRALIDGRELTARVVSIGERTVVLNPTSGPQRSVERAAILGTAEDELVLMAGEPPAALEPLSEHEARELEHLEARASEAFDTIRESGYAAGEALWEINQKRLYRATYRTFEEYCRSRWEIGRAQAYALMDFAKTRAALSARADIPTLPENAKQVRELKAAGDLAPEAWLLAVQRKGNNEQPTSKEVAQAVDATKRWQRPPRQSRRSHPAARARVPGETGERSHCAGLRGAAAGRNGMTREERMALTRALTPLLAQGGEARQTLDLDDARTAERLIEHLRQRGWQTVIRVNQIVDCVLTRCPCERCRELEPRTARAFGGTLTHAVARAALDALRAGDW